MRCNEVIWIRSWSKNSLAFRMVVTLAPAARSMQLLHGKHSEAETLPPAPTCRNPMILGASWCTQQLNRRDQAFLWRVELKCSSVRPGPPIEQLSREKIFLGPWLWRTSESAWTSYIIAPHFSAATAPMIVSPLFLGFFKDPKMLQTSTDLNSSTFFKSLRICPRFFQLYPQDLTISHNYSWNACVFQ